MSDSETARESRERLYQAYVMLALFDSSMNAEMKRRGEGLKAEIDAAHEQLLEAFAQNAPQSALSSPHSFCFSLPPLRENAVMYDQTVVQPARQLVAELTEQLSLQVQAYKDGLIQRSMMASSEDATQPDVTTSIDGAARAIESLLQSLMQPLSDAAVNKEMASFRPYLTVDAKDDFTHLSPEHVREAVRALMRASSWAEIRTMMTAEGKPSYGNACISLVIWLTKKIRSIGNNPQPEAIFCKKIPTLESAPVPVEGGGVGRGSGSGSGRGGRGRGSGSGSGGRGAKPKAPSAPCVVAPDAVRDVAVSLFASYVRRNILVAFNKAVRAFVLLERQVKDPAVAEALREEALLSEDRKPQRRYVVPWMPDVVEELTLTVMRGSTGKSKKKGADAASENWILSDLEGFDPSELDEDEEGEEGEREAEEEEEEEEEAAEDEEVEVEVEVEGAERKEGEGAGTGAGAGAGSAAGASVGAGAGVGAGEGAAAGARAGAGPAAGAGEEAEERTALADMEEKLNQIGKVNPTTGKVAQIKVKDLDRAVEMAVALLFTNSLHKYFEENPEIGSIVPVDQRVQTCSAAMSVMMAPDMAVTMGSGTKQKRPLLSERGVDGDMESNRDAVRVAMNMAKTLVQRDGEQARSALMEQILRFMVRPQDMESLQDRIDYKLLMERRKRINEAKKDRKSATEVVKQSQLSQQQASSVALASTASVREDVGGGVHGIGGEGSGGGSGEGSGGSSGGSGGSGGGRAGFEAADPTGPAAAAAAAPGFDPASDLNSTEVLKFQSVQEVLRECTQSNKPASLKKLIQKPPKRAAEEVKVALKRKLLESQEARDAASASGQFDWIHLVKTSGMAPSQVSAAASEHQSGDNDIPQRYADVINAALTARRAHHGVAETVLRSVAAESAKFTLRKRKKEDGATSSASGASGVASVAAATAAAPATSTATSTATATATATATVTAASAVPIRDPLATDALMVQDPELVHPTVRRCHPSPAASPSPISHH